MLLNSAIALYSQSHCILHVINNTFSLLSLKTRVGMQTHAGIARVGINL